MGLACFQKRFSLTTKQTQLYAICSHPDGSRLQHARIRFEEKLRILGRGANIGNFRRALHGSHLFPLLFHYHSITITCYESRGVRLQDPASLPLFRSARKFPFFSTKRERLHFCTFFVQNNSFRFRTYAPAFHLHIPKDLQKL
jgi:hypothetical protein